MGTDTRSARAEFLAMGLLTMSVLIFEIAITRLLSVVLWYHFAFLSVSVAMLGLGASGLWFSLRKPSAKSLNRSLISASLSIPLSIFVIVKAKPSILDWGLGPAGWIGTIIVAMLVPMYCLGAAICLLMIATEGKLIGRMYAADLLGGALGAVVVIPLMGWIATPKLLALVGILPLLSLAILDGVRRPAWFVGSAVIACACVWGGSFDVTYNKLHAEAGTNKPSYEVWTPTARITVFERPIFSPRPDVPWGWGYGSNFQPHPSPERWIDQDGSAGTPVENVRSSPAQLEHLLFDVTSLAYQVVGPSSVCILGAGGGRDILTALAAGAHEVDAVEINRAIVALLEGPLASFSGDVYRLPGVNAVVSEGRSFLTHTTKRYDLIQVSLVDSWAATAAGAFSLSENYLYTVEAFRLYLRRLGPAGMLTVSRWTDAVQPFEAARLILLAEEALRQERVTMPRDHLLMMSGGAVGTLIVSKQALSEATLRKADQVARLRGFERLWPAPDPASNSLVPLVMSDGNLPLLADAGLDLAPPVDDRPFFFQTARLFQLRTEPRKLAASDPNLQSIATLRLVLAILTALTLALFFVPLLVFDRPTRGRGFWPGCGYFACIGAGFMLLEIPWIQRSISFLEHPSYAAAVVLGSILLGAGLGAALSSRVPLGASRWLLVLLPLVAGATCLLSAPLFQRTVTLRLEFKVAIASMLFGVAGVFMGQALPLGFVSFGDGRRAWFWAVNGACGVLASALSVALAMALGFLTTSLIGVGFYVVAIAILLTAGRSGP
jgi:spermidine synthase